MQINVDLVYPIGSIYMTTSTVSPAVLFGGTWERIKGRCIVGVDEDDTDFETASKTGGSKYLQKHRHKWSRDDGVFNGSIGGLWSAPTSGGAAMFTNDTAKYTGAVVDVNTGNSGNLQPYYTAYIWRRTA